MELWSHYARRSSVDLSAITRYSLRNSLFHVHPPRSSLSLSTRRSVRGETTVRQTVGKLGMEHYARYGSAGHCSEDGTALALCLFKSASFRWYFVWLTVCPLQAAITMSLKYKQE